MGTVCIGLQTFAVHTYLHIDVRNIIHIIILTPVYFLDTYRVPYFFFFIFKIDSIILYVKTKISSEQLGIA